jgi:hypothetical protein
LLYIKGRKVLHLASFFVNDTIENDAKVKYTSLCQIHQD